MKQDSPSQGSALAPRAQRLTYSPVGQNKTHSCKFCGLFLSSANALLEHTRIHTGERPFGCGVCGKRFTQKAHLNIHKRTHTGEKPYACNICDKRFAQSSHLTCHKRMHLEIKPFRCQVCDAGFTQKQRLDLHMRKHSHDTGQPQEISSRMRGQPRPLPLIPSEMNKLAFSPSFQDMNMMQEMQCIKQELGLSKWEANLNPYTSRTLTTSPSNGGRLEPDASYTNTVNMKQEVPVTSRYNQDSLSNSPSSVHEENSQQCEVESQVESGETPSPTSEGMFMHPLGYVAFRGTAQNHLSDDSKKSKDSSNIPSPSDKHLSISDSKPFLNSDDSSPKQIQNTSNIEGFNRHGNLAEFNGYQPSASSTNNTSSQIMNFLEGKSDQTTDNSSTHYHQTSQQIVECNLSHQNILSRGGGTTTYTKPISCEQSSSTSRYINNNSSNTDNSKNKSNSKPKISLVNFTAEEIISHLMKREDVHKCPMCCIVFQDSAMYHLHRNMHDKHDLHRCNICGLQMKDKYDFTAHLLQMHQR